MHRPLLPFPFFVSVDCGLEEPNKISVYLLHRVQPDGDCGYVLLMFVIAMICGILFAISIAVVAIVKEKMCVCTNENESLTMTRRSLWDWRYLLG